MRFLCLSYLYPSTLSASSSEDLYPLVELSAHHIVSDAVRLGPVVLLHV